MINAGKYNKKIEIYEERTTTDKDGFINHESVKVLETWASVKTTRGMTIIRNDSDFEKALTNFTIRWPNVVINRKMRVHFNNKVYSIEYLNNINEDGIELEMQCKEITH